MQQSNLPPSPVSRLQLSDQKQASSFFLRAFPQDEPGDHNDLLEHSSSFLHYRPILGEADGAEGEPEVEMGDLVGPNESFVELTS